MLPLPKSDAEPFQDITDTQWDQFLADFTAAAIAPEQAVTRGTHNGEAQAWQHRTTYCESIGCIDLFMKQLTQNEQISMLRTFAMAVREGWFSKDCHKVLVEGTVWGAVSHVVQTFRAAERQNPTKDNDREFSILLSRQYRTYKNEDPWQKQRKALPFIVLDKLAKRQDTELDIALGQLTIGAAFFACCSCKYLTVPKREERRTKLLCLQNIRFFKKGHLIPAPSADLESADSIAITFEMQKNDSKFDTVIHGQTDDPLLCPVLQWAQLVNRILSYPNTTCDTPVCAVWCHGRLDKIASTKVLLALCAASKAVGSACLGFEPSEMGMHSLCSGSAMEMYLVGLPVYTIMLIVRWSSDAFLHYIRKQVEQFLRHVTKQMLTFWLFWKILEIAPTVVLIKDPRQCNHCDNAKTRQNIGGNMSQRVKLPSFSVSTNWLMAQGKLMEEASSSWLPKGIRGGENWIKNSIPNPIPSCTSHVHFFNCISEMHMASKLLCCLDADWGVREQG